MRHFDCQLLGGWVLFNGQLAEMQTGEGKTLTAALPACTAALAGVPVHIVTSNDYLASRDAELLLPLYKALGLSVGVVREDMDFDARRAACACDITHCSNKQVTFDYLRDRVERGQENSKLQLDFGRPGSDPTSHHRLMLRGLCYAIVDEADSVLIDEARTPLILSRSLERDQATQASFREALDMAACLNPGEDFRIEMSEHEVTLSESGRERLKALAAPLGPLWAAPRRREELIGQALMAQHLFIRDREYVVHDGKVQIVDAHTGRVMADRSWEHGLQQMVETKEACELSAHKQTLARISYQRFFRRYLKLVCMTGTAREVEREMGEVYGLSVVRIPTHRPPRRVARPPRVFAQAEDRDAAVVASARAEQARERAVLIGTRSVLMSEHLGRMFSEAGVEPQILNARQNADEACIIAQAGQAGRITVATNMAGRGTDISLDVGVADNGGLHVIVTERNDAARIDRQLVGRCARQGDAGSCQMFASLEDEIPSVCLPPALCRLLAMFARGAGRELPGWLGKTVLNRTQRSLERRHEGMRRQLEREDERLSDVLAFTGQRE
jgi:preprotein translocase subunit SecA